MKKARKVRLSGKAPSTKPRIGHRRAKPKTRAKPEREAKESGREPREARGEGRQEAKEAKRPAMNARLAAMVAASAELEEVPEPVSATKSPGPGGVDWKDLEDEEPGPQAAKPEPEARPVAEAKPPAKQAAKLEPAAKAPVKAEVAPPESAEPRRGAVVEDDGMQVVRKAPTKFSLEDLEVLRGAIKVRGAGTVIDGIDLDAIKYDGEGLVPVVAQDRRTGAVLQLGWGNKESIEKSLRSKQMVYYNKEHGRLMEKEGHAQRLVQMRVDCDKDALLALVDQDGPACHLDKGTCWHDDRTAPVATFLGELDRQIAFQAKTPKADSEVAKLMGEPLAALKAFVEDANNVTRALQGKPGSKPVEHEAADTLFHLLVACRMKGVSLDKIVTELFAREIAKELNT
jgi:phosphoribosyl-AMP cyclohydrolase / phosphoribosyl-ATP pyrophosphohydrolase